MRAASDVNVAESVPFAEPTLRLNTPLQDMASDWVAKMITFSRNACESHGVTLSFIPLRATSDTLGDDISLAWEAVNAPGVSGLFVGRLEENAPANKFEPRELTARQYMAWLLKLVRVEMDAPAHSWEGAERRNRLEPGEVVLHEDHRYIVGAVHRTTFPHRASIVRENETKTVELSSLRIPVLSELLVLSNSPAITRFRLSSGHGTQSAHTARLAAQQQIIAQL